MTTMLTMPVSGPASLQGLVTTSATGPRPRDLVILGLGTALILAELALRTGRALPELALPELALRGPTVAITLAMIVMLPWRRRHPLLVVIGVTVLGSALELTKSALELEPAGMAASIVLLSVPFALFRYGTRRMRPLGGLVLAVGLSLSQTLGGRELTGVVLGLALVGVAALSGVLLRERSAARDRELEMARSLERESLARDLHDTVAHHVTTIAIRAQVARAVPEDRALVAESLEVIEAESLAVLAEMRSLVRVLRAPEHTPDADSAAMAPALGFDHLAALADPGPPRVTVDLGGIDGAQVGQVLETTLFRLAQEGVTNARRHARGALEIEVTVRATEGEMVLTVRDEGTAATSHPTAAAPDITPGITPGAGHGLTGMRERTAQLGGTLEAGSTDGGGWLLQAVFPARPTGEER